jgi:hypothetical protein
LFTNGFSAEFGNTPGLIMNAVTPSGTNAVHGSASYRFRRTPFYARPFQYTSVNDLPETTADNVTFAVGGPIIKDRWHFYGGYEYVDRDLTAESGRLVTIRATDQAALIASGVPASAFVAAIPTSQKVNFYIFRTDAQINENNRLSGRFNYFDNNSPDNIAGGLILWREALILLTNHILWAFNSLRFLLRNFERISFSICQTRFAQFR